METWLSYFYDERRKLTSNEYCVMHIQFPDEPHRGPWTLQECIDWIKEWERDGGRGGVFFISIRNISSWRQWQGLERNF